MVRAQLLALPPLLQISTVPSVSFQQYNHLKPHHDFWNTLYTSLQIAGHKEDIKANKTSLKFI
jgi:hypothetical protein